MQQLSLFVWYSLSSGAPDEPLPVTRAQFKDWLTAAGIDPLFVPAAGRSIDAFRSATTTATDEYEGGDPDWMASNRGEIPPLVMVRLVVRETKQTAEYVMRQVFLQWTGDDHIRHERRVADLQFFRPRRMTIGRVPGTERLRTLVDQRLNDLHRARVEAFVGRCTQQYKAHRERLSTHAVRGIVRDYLISLGGVAVTDSGGGAYLVAPEQRELVEAMAGIVRRCGSNCRMRLIPLFDEPDLREMVLESIDTDIHARALVLVRDIREWMAANPGKSPTTPRWNSWRQECQIMQDWLVQYTDRYEATFDRAGGALETLVELIGTTGRLVVADRRSA